MTPFSSITKRILKRLSWPMRNLFLWEKLKMMRVCTYLFLTWMKYKPFGVSHLNYQLCHIVISYHYYRLHPLQNLDDRSNIRKAMLEIFFIYGFNNLASEILPFVSECFWTHQTWLSRICLSNMLKTDDNLHQYEESHSYSYWRKTVPVSNHWLWICFQSEK